MYWTTIILFVAVSAGVVQSQCHVGWLHFQNSCYFFSTHTETWFDAANVSIVHSCKIHKEAGLAEVETVAEKDYLKHQVSTYKRSYWLGARDDVIEGQWEWNSEVPLDITDWSPGEPNNDRDQDCLHISSSNFMWDDGTCDSKEYYICERIAKGTESIIGKK